MSRLRWNSKPQEALETYDASVRQSIRRLYGRIGPLRHYTTGGEEQAATIVQRLSGSHEEFRTYLNMHSEMRAIDMMLQYGEWVYRDNKVTWANGQAIAREQFVTPIAHCGFCTLALYLLGLPLTTPTKGNFNLANNYVYLLPERIANDPLMITRYHHGGDGSLVKFKQSANALVQNNPADWVLALADGHEYVDEGAVTRDPVGAVMSWNDAMGRVLPLLRGQAWRAIYDVNNSG